jgi:rod shape-determining protein MreC
VQTNARLAQENALLREALSEHIGSRKIVYTAARKYRVIPSKVVNNDFRRSNNFITLDKGRIHGVEPGMGVISDQGTAGVVKSVTDHFATAYSLIHQDLLVSSELKSSGTLCTTQWDALDPNYSKLRFLPRHIPLRLGDTVITSGFNSVFPPGILIGTVIDFDLSPESTFYDVTLKLSNDFTSLKFLYIIKNRLKEEKDSLENLND